MLRNTFLILIATASLFASACQSAGNENTSNINKSAAAQTNAPPEFSGKITNQSNDPNAPKATVLEKGATPIPGIPSEEELKKQMQPQTKKTPPIAGIPSEEELKRQMNTPVSNQRIRETKPPEAAPDSNTSGAGDRKPRTVRKP